MCWLQREILLKPKSRGFHLVTSEITEQVPEIRDYHNGLAHIFILHTSAALSINENADPTVRSDMESHFNVMVPENAHYYVHTAEGPDDMPAHIKAAILGSNVSIPITGGRLNLGTWQGVYLCEHRDHARGRRLIVTLHGEVHT
ncbi:MAG: secondary thiamine-phosphate synthase enzyme YjbQ [Candidatus Krumholzibacteria bacterium]|nr:secondary thiamine-phosphate synthase enzyme YjbQ [Candidatus Krumholzibacteria bacterium]